MSDPIVDQIVKKLYGPKNKPASDYTLTMDTPTMLEIKAVWMAAKCRCAMGDEGECAGRASFDAALAAHDEAIRADEREKAAQIAWEAINDWLFSDGDISTQALRAAIFSVAAARGDGETDGR